MILNARTYEVRRYTSEIVDHVITETLDQITTVTGALQPVSSRDLGNFPEGFRIASGAKWKLYTRPGAGLRTGGTEAGEIDTLASDRIVIDDRVLYVFGRKDWGRGLLGYEMWTLVEPQTEVGRDA